MKNLRNSIAAVVAALILSAPAWAALKTVTLNVSGMTCEACPITVKKALEKVPGVSKVDVHYEKKQVVVTYDDAKINVDALVKATTNAGYPSQPEKVALAINTTVSGGATQTTEESRACPRSGICIAGSILHGEVRWPALHPWNRRCPEARRC